MKDLEKFLVRYGKTKKISSKRIAVLTSDNRVDLLKTIVNDIPGAKYDSTPTGASSAGSVKVESFTILAKPASKQGNKSAGIENEIVMIKSINDIIAENEGDPIDITIKAGTKKQVIRNVVNCKEMGRDTTGRKKADIILETTRNDYPISIKKDNAEIWESADSYWHEYAEILIDELVAADRIELRKSGPVYSLSPNFARKASKKEAKEVVFGSDLLVGNRGSVVQKTFSQDDFNMDYDKNMLTIKVSSIIRKPEDVKGDHTVWFLVRNDRTRKSIRDYPGIRVLAVYEKRINPNVLRVR